MRDSEGRFIKGNKGFWLGKKRPNLINTNAAKTMFKKGIRNNPKGEFKRKGKSLTYFALHHWIKRKLGRARLRNCINCGSNKFVEWSNISFEYKEDTDDWIALCASCHNKRDRKLGWGEATRRFSL